MTTNVATKDSRATSLSNASSEMRVPVWEKLEGNNYHYLDTYNVCTYVRLCRGEARFAKRTITSTRGRAPRHTPPFVNRAQPNTGKARHEWSQGCNEHCTGRVLDRRRKNAQASRFFYDGTQCLSVVSAMVRGFRNCAGILGKRIILPYAICCPHANE